MTQYPQRWSEPSATNPFQSSASRRQVLAAGGMGLGALLLTACGLGSSASPSASHSGGTPKKGGTLRLSISDGSSTDSLDPGLSISTSAYVLANSVFDQLATLDPDFTARPALAKSWTVNADATKWTINLRDGVKWHDGSDFSSKDVVYTINRWLDEKNGSVFLAYIAPYLDPSGIQAPNPTTVELNLKKPNGALMQTFANLPASSIVKDGTEDFKKTCIGTGPFKLTGWSAGQSWKVARNDAYWGGAPYLDGIDATITPDQNAKIQAVLAGSTDLTDLIPVSLWATLHGNSSVGLETIKNRNSWIFTFDQSQKPFDDPRVIEAIKLATDRQTMVQTALQGHGKVVADVPIAPDSSWYPKGLTPEYDVSKAKQLLADAGHSGGLDITLSTSAAVPGMQDAAQAFQQVVKDAGINVKLDSLPLDTYWSKGWMATPAFMDYWTSFFPPVGFDSFYSKDASFLETHYYDPNVQSLIDKVLATTDPAQQVQLTQQAYLQARKTYGYVIPVFADAAYAKSQKVNGIIWTVAAFDFRKTWIA